MLAGEHHVYAQVVKNPIQVTARERKRLEQNKIRPDVPYHYRPIAVALAMRAADLLPDNSEELADVVNTAGGWIENSDEKLGDRIFQVIDRRCSKSKLGAQASAAHGFVDVPGPWSMHQETLYEAMHAALGDPKSRDLTRDRDWNLYPAGR